MARELNQNKWYFAIINPVGFVSQKISNNTGGDAKSRVENWLQNLENLPKSKFNGTSADFEEYRRQWIQKCQTANATSWVHGKNNTLNQCESTFDEYTKAIQEQIYSQNASAFDGLKNALSKNQNTIVVMVVLILIVGLIIYLLM